MIVPVPLGDVKATLTADVLDTVAVPMVGELDIVVTDVEALDETDVPLELVEVTEKVYGVFAVNPVTLIGDDVPVPVKPPGLLVTVYPVIVPVPLGAVNSTITVDVLDTVAIPIVGELDIVNCVIVNVIPIPTELLGVTTYV